MYHAENSGVAEGEIKGLAKDGYNRAQFKENYMTEICSDSEESSYLRRIDDCITARVRLVSRRARTRRGGGGRGT